MVLERALGDVSSSQVKASPGVSKRKRGSIPFTCPMCKQVILAGEPVHDVGLKYHVSCWDLHVLLRWGRKGCPNKYKHVLKR